MKASLLILSAGVSAYPSTRPCSASTFDDVLPPEATVVSAHHVSNGSSYGEGTANIAFPANTTNLPDLCAVTVNVTSSPSSSYRFGLFLPARWNRRYLAVGTGGYAGGINWLDMGSGVRYGHAVAASDTGHNSTALDADWALHHPESREDWGYRAVHGTVETSKKMVEAYYGDEIAYSYWSGASTGGRQGLKEAQIAPDSFDGLLIGCPAWWSSHLEVWHAKIATYNSPATDPKHLPADLFAVVAAEAVKQCDAADGLVDGIVSHPDRCDFDSSALLCGRGTKNASACLSPEQVATVDNFYADYVAEGRLAFPGLSVGSEVQWSMQPTTETADPSAAIYIRNFLYDDADWSMDAFNDSIVWEADAADPGDATADDYAALTKFRDRGGRILMYHGLADGGIATGSSELFYERVGEATGPENLRSWFRYFPVPGMQHVGFSPVAAPWYFAGANTAALMGLDTFSVPGFEDAEHDALLALMAWVERDEPVERLVATLWKEAQDPKSGVARQRPLCAHPQRQTYDEGDPDKAESFSCR